jgi:hypothetical protein
VVVDCCFCSVVCSDPPFACYFCVIFSSQFKDDCVTGGSHNCCSVIFALLCVLTLPLPAIFVLSFLLSLRTTVSLVVLTTVAVSWVDKWDGIALNPYRRLILHHQWKKWNESNNC